MATTWPSVARTDFAANKAVTSTRATGVIQRDLCLLSIPWHWEQAEVSTASTSWVQIGQTQVVRFPEWAYGKTMNLCVRSKVTGGVTGYLRLVCGASTGSEIAIASAAYAVTSAMTAAVAATGAVSWHLEAKAGAASTIYAKSDGMVCCWVSD